MVSTKAADRARTIPRTDVFRSSVSMGLLPLPFGFQVLRPMAQANVHPVQTDIRLSDAMPEEDLEDLSPSRVSGERGADGLPVEVERCKHDVQELVPQ